VSPRWPARGGRPGEFVRGLLGRGAALLEPFARPPEVPATGRRTAGRRVHVAPAIDLPARSLINLVQTRRILHGPLYSLAKLAFSFFGVHHYEADIRGEIHKLHDSLGVRCVLAGRPGRQHHTAGGEIMQDARIISQIGDRSFTRAQSAQDFGEAEALGMSPVADHLVVTRRVAEIGVIHGVSKQPGGVGGQYEDGEHSGGLQVHRWGGLFASPTVHGSHGPQKPCYCQIHHKRLDRQQVAGADRRGTPEKGVGQDAQRNQHDGHSQAAFP